MKPSREKIRFIIEGFLTICLFVFFSYLVQSNMNFFEGFILDNFVGKFVYFLLTIISIVLAPFSSLPLMAIASNLFGILQTAVLSISGWLLGSIIAFYLSRKYGTKIVSKLVSLSTIYKFENKLTQNQKFWFVLFMRMIFPVDLLSYALGLFTRISFKIYLITTLIGIVPFAFLYAYLGKLPYHIQPIIFLGIGIILGTIFILYLIIKKTMRYRTF